MGEHDSLYVETAEPNAYRLFHLLIRRERGNAADHPCSAPGCAEQARNWAWMKTGPWSSGLNSGNAVSWGLDAATYAPMCARDAARMDAGGTLTHCPSGHLRTIANTYIYPTGRQECRACRAEKRKSRRALRVLRACHVCGLEVLERNLGRHRTLVHHPTHRSERRHR